MGARDHHAGWTGWSSLPTQPSNLHGRPAGAKQAASGWACARERAELRARVPVARSRAWACAWAER